jgi:hypothetical protein
MPPLWSEVDHHVLDVHGISFGSPVSGLVVTIDGSADTDPGQAHPPLLHAADSGHGPVRVLARKPSSKSGPPLVSVPGWKLGHFRGRHARGVQHRVVPASEAARPPAGRAPSCRPSVPSTARSCHGPRLAALGLLVKVCPRVGPFPPPPSRERAGNRAREDRHRQLGGCAAGRTLTWVGCPGALAASSLSDRPPRLVAVIGGTPRSSAPAHPGLLPDLGRPPGPGQSNTPVSEISNGWQAPWYVPGAPVGDGDRGVGARCAIQWPASRRWPR